MNYKLLLAWFFLPMEIIDAAQTIRREEILGWPLCQARARNHGADFLRSRAPEARGEIRAQGCWQCFVGFLWYCSIMRFDIDQMGPV